MPAPGVLIVGLLLGVLASVVTLLALRRVVRAAAEESRLRASGIATAARLRQVRPGGVTVVAGSRRFPGVILSLEVHPAGADAYALDLPTHVEETQLAGLRTDSWVRVRVDASARERVALDAVELPSQEAAQSPGAGTPVTPVPRWMNARTAVVVALVVGAVVFAVASFAVLRG